MDVVYDRAALLGKLRLVQPAIARPAAARLASIFENVWLTDYGLLASNDVIAIATPLDAVAATGGVHGGKLIGLISNCDCEVVRIGNGSGGLMVNAGFNATLAIDQGDPPFTWVTAPEDVEPILIDRDFAAALKLAASIVDASSTSTQARGITVVRSASGTLVYANDRMSIMRIELPDHLEPARLAGGSTTSILTLSFVDQLVRLAPGALWLAPGYALFESDVAGLWGRLLFDRQPLDHAGVMAKLQPAQSAPLPSGFAQAIVRAGLMAAPDATKKLPVKLSIDGEKMQIMAASAHGEVVDTLPFEHPACELGFDYRVVARILDKGFTQLGANRKGMLFSGDGLSYMMTALD